MVKNRCFYSQACEHEYEIYLHLKVIAGLIKANFPGVYRIATGCVEREQQWHFMVHGLNFVFQKHLHISSKWVTGQATQAVGKQLQLKMLLQCFIFCQNYPYVSRKQCTLYFTGRGRVIVV